MRIEPGDLVLDHRDQELALVISLIRESNGYVEISLLRDGKRSQVHQEHLSVVRKRRPNERH